MHSSRVSKTLTILTLILSICISKESISQTTNIIGPSGSGAFGHTVTVLTNGNYVVTDPSYDNGPIANVGAVYLYDGISHNLISTLKGSQAQDQIGFTGITPLSNGNFVVSSQYWNNGSVLFAGASTWVNGVTGLNGEVSSVNSLVGTSTLDQVSRNVLGPTGTIPLANGNYLVHSSFWGSSVGAITWVNGATGIAGPVSGSNSLIGDNNNSLFGAPTVLSNGNYVLNFPRWNVSNGAVLWCNGLSGRVGITSTVINSGNSIIGGANHYIGGDIFALTNGNYLIISDQWDSGSNDNVGAVTWCNGSAVTTGTVTTSNSIIGSSSNDLLGSRIVALTNGNAVLLSPSWNDGSTVDVGAVTLLNGSGVTTGNINIGNSLVGSTLGDVNEDWSYVIPLTNGNYVVSNPFWDNGGITDAGAVTWGSGLSGVTGRISSSNSLVGSSINDKISWSGGAVGVVALTNGNFVVRSPDWDNVGITNAGAVTWGNGTTGVSGVLSATNSLVGSTANDQVGRFATTPLTNGNYVVTSALWDNGGIIDAGASTWGNGTSGITGAINSGNSLVGTSNGDSVGWYVSYVNGALALSNGNYVVGSANWNDGSTPKVGAATWCDGHTGRTGPVSTINSITGNIAGDKVSHNQMNAFSNSHYVFKGFLWDGVGTNSGFAFFGNGASEQSGKISACNSVLGSAINSGMSMIWTYNYQYDYMIIGRSSDNIVSIYHPKGMTLAVSDDWDSTYISGADTEVPLIANTGCRIIGTLTPTGANPVSGPVRINVWIEPPVPMYAGQPYVTRHYEITPSNNAGTSTGRITLYFTQNEFDEFNNHPSSTINLPTGPNDVSGIANLRIAKFSGTSSNGTGLAATYPGSPTEINPDDANIVWNSSLSRWEVTFDVTGFSGFFVQTNFSVVPLTLLEFNGRMVGNSALLTWKTTNEINSRSFEVERSTDGRNFSAIGSRTALNEPGIHTYFYSDPNVVTFGHPFVYYRLRQTDIDGTFTYTSIVVLPLNHEVNSISLQPNPVFSSFNVNVMVTKVQRIEGRIVDNTGRTIKRLGWNLSSGSNLLAVDFANFSKGIYYLELMGETVNKKIKFIKQ